MNKEEIHRIVELFINEIINGYHSQEEKDYAISNLLLIEQRLSQ